MLPCHTSHQLVSYLTLPFFSCSTPSLPWLKPAANAALDCPHHWPTLPERAALSCQANVTHMHVASPVGKLPYSPFFFPCSTPSSPCLKPAANATLDFPH